MKNPAPLLLLLLALPAVGSAQRTDLRDSIRFCIEIDAGLGSLKSGTRHNDALTAAFAPRTALTAGLELPTSRSTKSLSLGIAADGIAEKGGSGRYAVEAWRHYLGIFLQAAYQRQLCGAWHLRLSARFATVWNTRNSITHQASLPATKPYHDSPLEELQNAEGEACTEFYAALGIAHSLNPRLQLKGDLFGSIPLTGYADHFPFRRTHLGLTFGLRYSLR